MDVSIQVVEGQLICCYANERGKTAKADLSPLMVLGENLDQLLKIILGPIRLMSIASIRGHMSRLRLLGETLTHLKFKQLPSNPEDWQILVTDIHRYVLSRVNSRSSLKNRCSNDWVSIRFYLGQLVEGGVIPISTYLPPVRDTLDSVDIDPYKDRVLGQSAMKPIGPGNVVDKLICSINISRTDAQYLEELRETLSNRNHILKEALIKHWKYIKSNMEFGKKLIDLVDWPNLLSLINAHPTKEPKNHPAYPSSLEGLANYLAVIHHHYDGIAPSDDTLRKNSISPENSLIPRQCSFGSFEHVAKLTGAPSAPYNSGGWSNRSVLLWWQGRISHFDVAALTALLMILQPSWTMSALLFSEIVNRDNKNYLDVSEKGYSYEVKKHRAKSMKLEELDPLAYEIISTLIEAYDPVRRKMRENGDSRASLLFLPCSFMKISCTTSSTYSAFLRGSDSKKKVWLGSVYPELPAVGLTAGTLSFVKIRNTQGVLAWFKTKSMRAVARVLGNTEKVVLQHYIPKALLDAWNVRIIRRFQNLWLSVATANEDYLLEITDFSSIAELHTFLRDMLMLHSETDSPLSKLLHTRLGILVDEDFNIADNNAHLHIGISRAGLSALYSYQAAVIDIGLSSDILDKADIITGLTPRHLISLADLLQSQLPLDKNTEYVACHEIARSYSDDPINRKKWTAMINQSL
ncbi:hypothetical protein IQK56_02085 [Pseudomonas sp. MAFF 301449]|uniref:Integrase n=1 Tax=Pseudomonas cyclaminis TaxID=2781239 RepID=A0ABR9SLU0_9PSED|nr:hypothetical protein [Pseudomonas cyclaminis]MBE8589807.1 hypothetical protein [Pseudomonas cyclaminis]MBE8598811.1 hypothetical protein [Pseudomonas cyclaminis]